MKKLLIVLLFTFTAIFTQINALVDYFSFDGIDDWAYYDGVNDSNFEFFIEIDNISVSNLIGGESFQVVNNDGNGLNGWRLSYLVADSELRFLSLPGTFTLLGDVISHTVNLSDIETIRIVANNGTTEMYVNEVLVDSGSQTFQFNNPRISIGRYRWIGGQTANEYFSFDVYDFTYNSNNYNLDLINDQTNWIIQGNPIVLGVEYPLEINLDSNYNPFADIVYTSDFLTTTSSIVNDILTAPSQIQVSTNQANISPFTFQHWLDLNDNSIFTTSRTFTITDPNRDYNLRAIYDLTNSIDLSLDSDLPSPPNFNLEVDTIEQQRAIISQYPFIQEEIPFGYNFEVEAPTDNVGVYEFDYWWNNNSNTVFTTSAIISLDAIENYDLTATYSLPTEYQIVLTLFSNIGDITFKLGNQPAITGSFIEVTIGQGDSWTASGPLNANFQFQSWIDLETNNVFSTNRSFGVSNTTQNYILEATYWPIYDVYWDSQGGTLIPSQKIVSGGSVNAPIPNPIRPNFAFDGWALPSAPTTPITFPQIINNNVTYQAIWLTTYQLTFNVNAGQPINPQIVIENDTPSVVTPSRFGFTFEGWFTDNITFNNSFDFNAPFTSNTTIHAKWAFGTTANAQTSLEQFLENAYLDNPLAQWVIVLSLFILLNVMIFIYKGPFIVTSVLNFILTAIFIILGFIPIWIIIVLFMGIFGFMILMLSGGRS